jgi:two-component system, cell cycle sensor histidine kinase and response regulator CckA
MTGIWHAVGSIWRGFNVVRPSRVRSFLPAGTRDSVAVATLGLIGLAAGALGYYSENGLQSALAAVTYVWLPLLVFVCLVVGIGDRPAAVLSAVALLDVESALLGTGQLMAVPFAVALPFIGVALAARRVPASRMRVPYIAAWAGSSIAIAVAALRIAGETPTSVFVVIPSFMFVDAFALAMLWRLDTGLVHALHAAATAEARVRDLLDGVDLMAVNVSRDSRVDYINKFALELTGWSRDEVIGADWWDTFATPERREAARARYQEIIAGRIVMEHERESTIVTRSGDVRLIRWSHVTRHDADGQVAGVASLGEDITMARATEDEARRGAELLSKLVVSSPLPTVVMSMDRIVQLWNPAATELLGWTEDEVVGKRIPAGVYANDGWAVARTFARARRGEPMDHELTALSRRDGQIVRVRLYGGVLLDRDGKPMSVGLQAVDVTLAVAMEDHLREAQKMEAIGRLAGGVAHDFNNSLTAIGGFAALIATGSKEPETREAAETILGASKRAADLTRELLAYSRRSMLVPQVIDVNQMVGSVRPTLLRLLGEDISVVIESRVAQAMVRVDPSGLERVLFNLAANARDAMPDGGRLTISTDRRKSTSPLSTGSPPRIAIAVTDTGPGIPAEVQSRVFDPFFTTKPVGSGTGLGLAMVKGFVVQSGGDVDLLSEPGRGTTIEILLPEVADTQPSAAVESPGSGRSGGDETILVIEDEPSVAGVSFQVLSRAGYRVLLADSGESAIGLLRGHTGPIALLLVDVILPDMRGPQLVEVARAVHPESAVLFASGYSADSFARRIDLPDEVDLIEKPFEPEQLLRRVRKAMDRRPPSLN